ncbi:MAG: YlmC/YmxH family sporulation protein [Christensenellales bacterium]
METTFCELRGKEVINVTDGKRLGRIIDIVFDASCGRVLGFVVPCYNKSWNIFKSSDDIFIPFNNVCKIGDDVILVEIFLPNKQQFGFGKSKGRTSYLKTATVESQQNQTTENDKNITPYITKDINQ